MRLKPKGFTLIELLVVVAIIALLIAILIPSLAASRERARTTVCQTRMRAWGQGFHMYAADNNQSLPLDGFDGTTTSPIGVWNDTFLWFNGLTVYMGTGSMTYDQLWQNSTVSHPLPKAGDNSMFVCPSAFEALGAPGIGSDIMTPTNVNYPQGYFEIYGWDNFAGGRSHGTWRAMLLCYGMNSQLRQLTCNSWQDYPGVPDPPPFTPYNNDIKKMTQLNPSDKVPLLAEKRISTNELDPSMSNYNLLVTKNLGQSKVTANRFGARHKKGGNIVFADGHVEWFSNSSLNTGTGLNKALDYNIPNLVIWHPTQ
ncbi:MAG TPA: DUF1559 domain-containing protein [Phycisphaerae bacterium]|nr:DUF1559 domain-containing protein [Phycisphaerae bacterium]